MHIRRFIQSPYSITVACEGAVALSQLLVYKMVSHNWGAEGFAEFAIVRRTISLIQPAVALGLTVALPRQIAYLSEANENRGRSPYLAAALLIGGFSVAAATFILGANSRLSSRVLFGDAKYSFLIEAVIAMLGAITLHSIVYAYYRATRLHLANILQAFVLAILPPALLVITSGGLAVYFVRLAIGTAVISCFAAAYAKPHIAHLHNHVASLMRFGIARTPGELILAAMFAVPALAVTHYSGLLQGGFVAFGVSLLLMLGAAVGPVGVVLLPRASRMLAQGRIAELKVHVTRVACICLILTSTTFLVLEATLGSLVRAFLGGQTQAADIVTASRILAVAAIPYGMYICLRSVLDACHETAFNTRHVLASAATFGSLAVTSIMFGSTTYLGTLWSFVAGNWVLGGLTVLRLFHILADPRPGGNMSELSKDTATWVAR